MSAYISEAMSGNLPGIAKAAVTTQFERSRQSSEFSSSYQLQLHQLVQTVSTQITQHYPVVASWLVYLNPLTHQRHSFPASSSTVPESQPKEISEVLLREPWKNLDFPPAQFTKLAIFQDAHLYLYPITQQQEAGMEYWLLWVREPLSWEQCQCLTVQAQSLCYSLNFYQECCRQQAKTQLLEQIIQRTEHQLRNPLALIELYATTAEMGLAAGSSEETLRSQLQLLQETTREMGVCLKELAACSQQAKLQMGCYDLRVILQEVIHHLHPWLMQKHLQVVQSSHSVLLEVDFWQLKQVLINLIGNAVHFSPPEGTISCQWQVFHQEVLIEVRDEGPGLSSSDLSQIFTPFYSRRPGGTGLGLSISQKIILDHRGRIWAQNLPDGGAVFSFALPRASD